MAKSDTRPSEELLSAPLPDLVRNLGLAVAEANNALAKGGSGVIYTIPEAQIEVKYAISLSSGTEVGVDGGLKLHVFSVNASYKSTYSYTEEASSRIVLTLRAMPPSATPPPAPGKN